MCPSPHTPVDTCTMYTIIPHIIVLCNSAFRGRSAKVFSNSFTDVRRLLQHHAQLSLILHFGVVYTLVACVACDFMDAPCAMAGVAVTNHHGHVQNVHTYVPPPTPGQTNLSIEHSYSVTLTHTRLIIVIVTIYRAGCQTYQRSGNFCR